MKTKLLLLLLLLSLAGCAGETTMSMTAKGLLSGRAAIIGVADTANTLCSQGTLNQSQCDTAKEQYVKAQTAYKTGSDALMIWVTSGIDGGNKAQSSLAALNLLLGSMQTLVGGK